MARSRSRSPRKHICTWEGCGKSYPFRSLLAAHYRKHSGEKPFVCDFEGCGHSYRSAQELKNHRRNKHACEMPFVCDFCDRCYSTAQRLKRHKRTHMIGDKRRYHRKREEQVAKFLTSAGVTYEREVTVQFCG